MRDMEFYAESGLDKTVFERMNERFKEIEKALMEEFDLRSQDYVFYYAKDWWNKAYDDMTERYQEL